MSTSTLQHFNGFNTPLGGREMTSLSEVSPDYGKEHGSMADEIDIDGMTDEELDAHLAAEEKKEREGERVPDPAPTTQPPGDIDKRIAEAEEAGDVGASIALKLQRQKGSVPAAQLAPTPLTDEALNEKIAELEAAGDYNGTLAFKAQRLQRARKAAGI